MKKIFITCLVLGLTMPLSVNAFSEGSFYDTFTSAPFFNSKFEKRDVSIDISEVISEVTEKTQVIDSSVQKTFLNIASKLSTQNDSTALKSRVDSIISDTSKTQTEQNTIINQLLSDYASGLLSNKDSVSAIANKLSSDDKKSILDDISNLSNLAKEYSKLQKKELSVGDLISVLRNKNERENLTSQLSALASLLANRGSSTLSMANQLSQLAKIAGIN